MFLEGRQAKLGCSVVLSGPELDELKEVRKALVTNRNVLETLIVGIKFVYKCTEID